MSASYALSSSYAFSSSYALSASYALSSSHAVTASYSLTTLAAGSNGNIQYNNNGVLGGASTLQYDANNNGRIEVYGTDNRLFSVIPDASSPFGVYIGGPGVIGTDDIGLFFIDNDETIATYDASDSAFRYSNGAYTYYLINTTHSFSGNVGITNDLTVNEDVFFLNLTQTNQSNVITIDTATGKLYYTASSALGGGSGTTTNALTEGIGIEDFTFDGSSAVTVAVSGAANLTQDYLTQWSGDAFVDSDIEDRGSVVYVDNNFTVSGSFKVDSQDAGAISNPAFTVDSVIGVTSLGVAINPSPVAGGIYFDGSNWYFGV